MMADTKRKVGSGDGNEEPPPTKRQRVSRACDQCRSAREKCDGIQPCCYTCLSSNRTCSYTVNPKKRGIQPGYIRTLEITLAWVLSNVPKCEESLNVSLRDPQVQGIISGKDTDGSNKLHRKWRKSVACREIDRLLSGTGELDERRTLSPPPDADGDSDHETPPFLSGLKDDLAATRQAGIPDANSFAMLTPASAATENATALERLGSQATSKSCDPKSLAPLKSPTVERKQLPLNYWSLIDTYFAYSHCWFPIAEKTDVLKLSYSYSHAENGLDVSADEPGSGDHAELWSILAVASAQERLLTGEHPRNGHLESSDPKVAYRIARSLIPQEHGTFEIGHVKALLLLALLSLSTRSNGAWIMTGQAVRIALGLDLQHSTSGRGTHVHLACFLVDTLISTQLGQVPHMRRNQLGQIFLHEDGLDEWQPWIGNPESSVKQRHLSRSPGHNLSIFNALLRLSAILNDITSGVLSKQREQVMHLENWAKSVPKNCDFDHATGSATPQVLNLHLLYSSIRLVFATDNPNGTAEHIARLLESFANTHGFAVVPGIFRSYLAIINQVLNNLPLKPEIISRLTALSFKLNQPKDRDSSRSQKDMPLAMSLTSHPANMQTSSQPLRPIDPVQYSMSNTTSPITDGFGNPFAPNLVSPSLEQHQAMQPFDFTSTSMGATRSMNQGPQFENSALERYNSAASIDLDALFEELASPDGQERVDAQPLIMQNLGFGPDATINDVLGADFGGWDPLMNAYMQNTENKPGALDPRSSYSGG
ncbi:hypothetical protein K402DRAFT_57934 [Aulographum hederae CBS 113979]|uniref:Zn(2)-C6 fungal-type domain-containing protein n=1 Tax=Aulographum hederae CBS 113979 TaxID=1176131 RepID=A0A6G1H2P0_9PEZI|nr:hypothetical protein K402DRAFT_57934 [Aulographum hederae CBS 113979]